VKAACDTARATLAAYERWAKTYAPLPHNPLMLAEQAAMLELWPAVVGRRALDLACGSGRYARLLAQSGATHVTALDFSPRMLDRVSVGSRVCADMMRLPFASQVFDVIVSGLAVGHAGCLGQWMKESARVLLRGGTLLYSDFHPQAARAGHTRTFKDAEGRTCSVPHHLHGMEAHRSAAEAAGLAIESIREVRAGVDLRGPPIALVIRARNRCP
jgi:SAM-dependent methyltransferase